MPTVSGRAATNRLLNKVSAHDRALLEKHATPAEFGQGDILDDHQATVTRLYFPDDGVISVVTSGQTEAGLIGREGVTGHPALFGVARSPIRTMCQLPSRGTTIPVAPFLSVAASSPSLTGLMLRYMYTFTIQLSATVQSNGQYTVEQRLARWLMMCRDRSGQDELRLTHDFIAMMLSVRRPGVTVATHVLEGLGCIRATRGLITVRDVDKLREFAGDSYGEPEAEYERVMDDEQATVGLSLPRMPSEPPSTGAKVH